MLRWSSAAASTHQYSIEASVFSQEWAMCANGSFDWSLPSARRELQRRMTGWHVEMTATSRLCGPVEILLYNANSRHKALAPPAFRSHRRKGSAEAGLLCRRSTGTRFFCRSVPTTRTSRQPHAPIPSLPELACHVVRLDADQPGRKPTTQTATMKSGRNATIPSSQPNQAAHASAASE